VFRLCSHSNPGTETELGRETNVSPGENRNSRLFLLQIRFLAGKDIQKLRPTPNSVWVQRHKLSRVVFTPTESGTRKMHRWDFVPKASAMAKVGSKPSSREIAMQYQRLLELTARLNAEVSTSEAVHELLSSAYELLGAKCVTLYLSSDWEGSYMHMAHGASQSPRDDHHFSLEKRTLQRSPGSRPRSASFKVEKRLRVLKPVLEGAGATKEQFLPITKHKSDSVAGYVAFTKETVQLDRINPKMLGADDPLRNHSSALIVPIVLCSDKSCVGVLQCVDKPTAYLPSDVAILQAVAATAGNVLHKIMLLDNTLTAQRRASALLDLANASRHIREDSHVHLPNLIERLMLSVYKIMRADRVSLYLADNDKRELWCCISKDYKGSRIPFGTGIIGTVANSGLMLNIRDCYQDRRFDERGDRVTQYHTRSMLAAPVLSSTGKLVAVLVVINKIALQGSSEVILPPLSPNSSKVPTSFEDASVSSNTSGPIDSVIARRDLISRMDFQGASDADIAGITFFTREDEMVLESIATEVGNVLERNALDAHYERVINEVLHLKQRDFSKILTASLLAETTNNDLFQQDVKGLSADSFQQPAKASKRTLRTPSRLKSLRSPIQRKEHRAIIIHTAKGKEIMCKTISRLAYFFSAIGKFQRMLKRFRGFNFVVKSLEQCKCVGSPRQSAAKTKKRIKALTKKTFSSDQMGRTPTQVCPGAQYIINVEKSTAVVKITDSLRQEARGWCLDVFNLEPKAGPHLFRVALEELGLVDEFNISRRSLNSFVHAIRDSYLSSEICPYHNWDHALGVFQMCYAFLCQERTIADEVLTPTDRLALLVGAVGHDSAHEGRNNDFEIKIQSELAIRYNDRSVLEQHHAAMLFQILKRPGNNILQFTDQQTQANFRKVTIEAILATDMSSHFDYLKKVTNRLSDPLGISSYSRESQADRIEIVNFVLHSIDIGGQCYPKELSKEWSRRLINEFIAQANDERSLGFQPAPYMMDLEQPLRQATLQKSFTENIVLPAWQIMNKLFPSTGPLLVNLQENINEYNAEIHALSPPPSSIDSSAA